MTSSVRRSLLLLAFLLTVVGLILAVTGGFRTTALGLRFSARSPTPALIAAAVALAVWFATARAARAVHSDFERLDACVNAHPRWIVAILAAAAGLTAVVFNSFSATGSDPSGYLSESAMLLEGRLTYAEPLAALATWQDGEATLAPLGWRATGAGVQVPTYAIGLPLLLAPLHALGSAKAASLLIPASLALLTWTVGALAHRFAGASAAIIAATWMATSPVALIESMHVMSDVPVAAAWLLCWLFAFKERPLAAGIAAAVSVLIRPNLAPLAALPAAYLFTQRRLATDAPYAALAFATPVVVAGLVVGYVQWLWFGSPFRSGYGTAVEIYALANVAPNARLYGRWLLESHGPWLLAAPVAVFLTRHELRWMLLFAGAVAASYLVYAQFEVWTYLRFLLPALAVAMIAVATLAAAAAGRWRIAFRVVTGAAIVLGITATNIATARQLEVFRFADRHVRARAVGEELSAVLPVHSVIVSGEQSGAMRYYTGRSILRWDLMNDTSMREALDQLTLNRYHIWVVLDDWEEEAFRRRFSALPSISLDYEPVVQSAPGVGIRTRAWRAKRSGYGP
jgi:hypothetical protein